MTCKEIALTLGLGLGVILLSTSQMHGQNPGQDTGQSRCGERREIVAILAEEYGEMRQFMGLTFARQVVELFASPDTGTWTLTITYPSGETCLIGAGDMVDLAPDPLPAGDPT